MLPDSDEPKVPPALDHPRPHERQSGLSDHGPRSRLATPQPGRRRVSGNDGKPNKRTPEKGPEVLEVIADGGQSPGQLQPQGMDAPRCAVASGGCRVPTLRSNRFRPGTDAREAKAESARGNGDTA